MQYFTKYPITSLGKARRREEGGGGERGGAVNTEQESSKIVETDQTN